MKVGTLDPTNRVDIWVNAPICCPAIQRYLRTIVRRYIGRLSGAPETYT